MKKSQILKESCMAQILLLKIIKYFKESRIYILKEYCMVLI